MPVIYENDKTLIMTFDMEFAQSVMHKNDSERLALGYTRTMMGFLLFNSAPERIAMIGLGGGSLAKYCRKYMPDVYFTSVEVNPKVISMRDEFKIPPDDDRFQVIESDGADYVSGMNQKVDVLLVDGFDLEGHPPQLSSVEFYDHCYAQLNDGGVLVVNLLLSDQAIESYISRIQASFQGQVVVVDAEKDENKIAFAVKGSAFQVPFETMMLRAQQLGEIHPVRLPMTAKKIMNCLKLSSSYQSME